MIVIENKQFDTNVTATITSCGRFDLLKRTIESFIRTAGTGVNIKVYDDSAVKEQQEKIINTYGKTFDLYLGEERKGQAFALDFLYSKVETPWLFHMEDDWEFIKEGYLQESVKVLNADSSIMIVGLAILDLYFQVGAAVNLHEIGGVKVYDHPRWRIDERHGYWHGWIGSPNLKRKTDIDRLPKFSSVLNEEVWDRDVFGKSGAKSVWLEKCYVRHIGDGRTTFYNGSVDMVVRNWKIPGVINNGR